MRERINSVSSRETAVSFSQCTKVPWFILTSFIGLAQQIESHCPGLSFYLIIPAYFIKNTVFASILLNPEYNSQHTHAESISLERK